MSVAKNLHVIILAAGRGTRMKTHKPKVMHTLAGQTLLAHVTETALKLGAVDVHVVIGHEADKIRMAHPNLPVKWVIQEQQLGTGHAVMQVMPLIPDDAQILILSGDVPLVQLTTLEQMTRQMASLTLLVARPKNTFGLGRIARNERQQITAIIEEKDASIEQKLLPEIYTGICCVAAADLKKWLPQLSTNNASGEYYLTKIIEFAAQEAKNIASIEPKYLFETQGVNTLLELQQLERKWQVFIAKELLAQGVQIMDVRRLDVRGQINCASDVTVDVNVIIEGEVVIGTGVEIGANCYLKNTIIGDGVKIKPNSHLDGSIIGNNCEIGPFARLRPGTKLEANCKIGNFVEIKNSYLDESSKAMHLSYIGDAKIGRQVNIGCGTITCNYDGTNKYPTVIKNNAFIGSGTQLVAPVVVGERAFIAAGTTLRSDAPPNALTLASTKQRSILGWKKKVKEQNHEL